MYRKTVALLDEIFDALMDDIDSKNKEAWMKGIEELREFDSIRMNLLKFMESKLKKTSCS